MHTSPHKVEHRAPAEATPRGPEPEGPGEGGAHSSRTRPSGELGGKPRGRRTKIGPKVDDAEARSLERENEAADKLADNGYDVEQNPPPKPNGRKPDYKIEGEYFDCYAPDGDTPVTNVRDTLERKAARDQADRFVVNARDWTGTPGEISREIAERSNGTIKEVIVIRRDGSIVHAYP